MSEQIITKRCYHCKQIKPLSEFSKTRTRKGGLQSYCKSCLKAYQKAYQQSEKGKAVFRKASTKHRRTFKGKATMKRSYARHPNYRKAIYTVNHAIRAGRLSRPDSLLCHYCSNPAQQYHHWHGYEPEHWLDVVPACRECHKKEHRKIA